MSRKKVSGGPTSLFLRFARPAHRIVGWIGYGRKQKLSPTPTALLNDYSLASEDGHRPPCTIPTFDGGSSAVSRPPEPALPAHVYRYGSIPSPAPAPIGEYTNGFKRNTLSSGGRVEAGWEEEVDGDYRGNLGSGANPSSYRHIVSIYLSIVG